jgi:hypothetical protein
MVVSLGTAATCLAFVRDRCRLAVSAARPDRVGTTGFHLNLYDFTRAPAADALDRGGEGDDAERAEQLRLKALHDRAPWYTRLR